MVRHVYFILLLQLSHTQLAQLISEAHGRFFDLVQHF